MQNDSQVREKSSLAKSVVDEIAEFIQTSYPNNESGIVYCFSRKECEQVCNFFNLLTGPSWLLMFILEMRFACDFL